MIEKYKKVSDDYWIHLNPEKINKSDEPWVKVKGERIKLKGFAEFDLFFHKDYDNDNYWSISEAMTGQCLEWRCSSKEEAMIWFKEKIKSVVTPKDNLNKGRERGVAAWGVSPRYTERLKVVNND